MAHVNANGVKAEEEEEEELEADDLFFEVQEEDSEEEVPLAAQRRNKDQIDFGVRLTPPRATTYSCSSLLAWIETGKIDLEAEYQRDVVWSDKKQSALLDSIYRLWYVPPVLFSLRTIQNEDGEAEQVRVCIDGKQVREKSAPLEKGEGGADTDRFAAWSSWSLLVQRLTSIRRFMKNEIPIYEPDTNRAFYFKKTAT
jgi:hypothetical protein